MSDISKCNGNGCDIKKSCYRFTCKPHPFWQAYIEPIYDKKSKSCKMLFEYEPIIKKK